VSAVGIPLTTDALRKEFEGSAVHRDVLMEIDEVNSLLGPKEATRAASDSELTRRQFYTLQSGGVVYHTLQCLRRQAIVMARSPTFIIPRIMQSLVMGLVIGSLFYGLGTGTSDFSPRLGLVLYALTFVAFSNMAEGQSL
jgi:hypothetical protein